MPTNEGRALAKPTIGARQHRLCCLCSRRYLQHAPPRPHTRPHTRTTQHPCTQQHLTPTSLCTPTPPHPHLPTHHFFCKFIDPRLCVRFFVKGARSMGPATPTHLGKVYKRALVVPLSSPHQRAFVCGACIGTAQVGVSLVSLFQSTLQTV